MGSLVLGKQPENWRRGHWEKGICIKLSEIYFQIRDSFTTILRTLSLMYETKYQQSCAILAGNLRQICATPPSRTPPSRDFWCKSRQTEVGRTPKGSCSPRGHSRHLLETPFWEPLLRTLLRTLSYCNQRAANGGSDPSWLNLAFLGRPDFPSRGPQIPILKGFWDLWTENWGAPKTPSPTTTDLTPHLRPSDVKLTVPSSTKRLHTYNIWQSIFLARLQC